MESFSLDKIIRGLSGGPVVKNHLPVQGTQVRSLVQEDSACCGASKPVCHDSWAQALEALLRNKRSHHNEKPGHCN